METARADLPLLLSPSFALRPRIPCPTSNREPLTTLLPPRITRQIIRSLLQLNTTRSLLSLELLLRSFYFFNPSYSCCRANSSFEHSLLLQQRWPPSYVLFCSPPRDLDADVFFVFFSLSSCLSVDTSQPSFPVYHRKFGNPSPLGLFAFALTTFVLSWVRFSNSELSS